MAAAHRRAPLNEHFATHHCICCVTDAAAAARTECDAASVETGISTDAGFRPGLEAVTVIADAAAPAPLGATTTVRRPLSASICDRRERCGAGVAASCVTCTTP